MSDNKTHGVLTDAQISEVWRKTPPQRDAISIAVWFARAIEAAVLAKTAPQSPVAPADERAAFEAWENSAPVLSQFAAWQARARLADAPTVSAAVPDAINAILRDIADHALQVSDHTSKSFNRGFMMLADRARKALKAAPTPPTASATDAKIAELLDIVEHPVSFPSTIEDPATRWEQSRRMQCSACYAKEDENEAIEHLDSCVWHKALAQRDRMRELVRDLRNAAPTPPTSAADKEST